MDANFVSMLWWGIPALVLFAISAVMAIRILCLAGDKKGETSEMAVAALALFLSALVAWPCYAASHAHMQEWLSAEPAAEASAGEAK